MTKKSILIVDDSVNTLIELSGILEKHGHIACTAPDGDSGFETLRDNSEIALCLTDFNMPGCNGLEMIQKVRNEIPGSATKFIMSTTEFNPALKKEGKALGVSAWILKPIKEDRLSILLSKFVNLD